MSLGGGSYSIENKVLPGAYINFVTTKRGVVPLGERGTGVFGMEMYWTFDDVVIAYKDTIRQDCKKLFGYDYNSAAMIDVREFFRHGNKLIAINIAHNGEAATFKYGEAAAAGIAGNKMRVTISRDVDNVNNYIVDVYWDKDIVDTQIINSARNYINNKYIKWTNFTDGLEVGTYKLSGGSNGYATGEDIIDFCNKLDNYNFNSVALLVDDETAEKTLIEYTKKYRDEKGLKFQCVTHIERGDHEGVVTVYNNLTSDEDHHMLSWVCGALAGCGINESLTNMKYDGELSMFNIDGEANLTRLLNLGYFVFHIVNDEIRVLRDINTLVTYSDEKGEAMSNNQTVRVCDQIAMDIASLFAKYYLGRVPNDKAGRNSLWSDLVKYHENLMDMRAIEDFDEGDIEVDIGESKTSVVISENILPVNVMDKLYMKVFVE